MSVTYDIDDKFCPDGHKWIRVGSTLLYSDCYYCKQCDKIYEPSVKEVPKAYFKKTFSTDRFNGIKKLALMLEARDKVDVEDLVKLGYLKI